MTAPDPALAPEILPVIVPMVHVYILAKEAVNVILGLKPLQMVAVFTVVTTGAGFTVTVIVYGTPAHKPATEVGVTIYSTVPDVKLLGLVSV
jgi:hypothetical protein